MQQLLPTAQNALNGSLPVSSSKFKMPCDKPQVTAEALIDFDTQLRDP